MRPVFRLAILLAPFLLTSCKSKPVVRYWTAMDCNFDATLHGPGGPMPAEKALDLVVAESHRLDHLFSDYDATSPLSVLRGRKGDTVVVGSEIALVLRKALVAMHVSGNAFDPGMHDLKQLWGIGTERGHVPSRDSIEALLVRRFGFLPKSSDTLPEPFAVLPNNRVVLLTDSLPIDLGGIAKGYSVDRLSAVLDSVGWPRHLIQGGGEIIAAGRKESGSWHIGIKNPRRTDTIVGVIRSDSTGAVSTSGDYERFFIEAGVRYHHIFDPPTGHPARGGTVSVTVLCPTSLDCDAFTKPLFIMGPARSRHLADSLGLQAFWIRETPDGLCARVTSGWGDRLQTALPGCPADW